jgi:hypothetical protein
MTARAGADGQALGLGDRVSGQGANAPFTRLRKFLRSVRRNLLRGGRQGCVPARQGRVLASPAPDLRVPCAKPREPASARP